MLHWLMPSRDRRTMHQRLVAAAVLSPLSALAFVLANAHTGGIWHLSTSLIVAIVCCASGLVSACVVALIRSNPIGVRIAASLLAAIAALVAAGVVYVTIGVYDTAAFMRTLL